MVIKNKINIELKNNFIKIDDSDIVFLSEDSNPETIKDSEFSYGVNYQSLDSMSQLSTARDMAILGMAVRKNHPNFFKLFKTKSFIYKGVKYTNHNNLLSSYSGTDGIKTGYTNASGFNLVASVERNGQRIIGVVFGGKKARSRDKHMICLLYTSPSPRDEKVSRMPSSA